MSKKIIENAKVVLETGILFDGVIVTEGDRILAVGKRGEVTPPDGAERIDAHGAYVGPGFVDIHVHGGNNLSTCLDAVEACEFFLRHGTTSLLATPAYSMGFDEFIANVRAAKAAMGKARTLRGLYLEGPYTNGKYGAHAHRYAWYGQLKPEQYTALVDAAGDAARVWTIAPERKSEGLCDFMEYARSVQPSVVFAVGHSEATPGEIRALGKYRPTLQTHSMDATGRLPVSEGTRAVGPDEYCFHEPSVYCEMISDSLAIHVQPEMQKLLIHTKGVHHVVLITDSTVRDNPNPPELSHVTDLNFDDRGGISGSKMTMELACRNVMTHTTCGIAEAFMMASGNPARAIGLDDEIGSIEVGKRADLVFCDDIFNVKQVMLGGEIVV
ncbi:MAG: amidohydrolase family protein [Clostridia bacterium]|nr:amidohydrolase family protein [Clostridia bacterium]